MNESDIITRNKRVEADKAWETSKVRRSIIAIITYIIVGFYLSLLGVSYAWLHAFVPPLAYILSTLTLVHVKRFWINHFHSQ